jgi:nucleotide-binding universal stress UspA family protein
MGVVIDMIFSKILVAYDGSDLSKRGLDSAIEIAAANPAVEIQVVHVAKFMAPIIGGGLMVEQTVNDNILRMGEEMMGEVEKVLAKLKNPSKTFVLADLSPSGAILNHAKENGCDLIVMGSRGLGGLRLFLGSVSYGVVQEAEIPVLIIK